VEFLGPVVGVGHQEVAHLVAPVVEDVGAPVGLLTPSRVSMFVERGAVETWRAPTRRGESGGHPVEDHPDALAVQDIDEVAENRRERRAGPSERSSR